MRTNVSVSKPGLAGSIIGSAVLLFQLQRYEIICYHVHQLTPTFLNIRIFTNIYLN